HTVAGVCPTGADEVRRAAIRTGADEAFAGTSARGPWPDRRSDRRAWGRQVAPNLRIQNDCTERMPRPGGVLSLAWQGVGLSAGNRVAQRVFRDCSRGRRAQAA